MPLKTPEQLRALLEDSDAATEALRRILANAFDPGDHLTADRWAEKNLTLTPKMTRFSGPLQLGRTPYLRGPLMALTHEAYERILLVWAGQLAKSTFAQIAMAYLVDQDPGPMMLAYPDQNMAKRRSRGHLRPMIVANECLNRRLLPRPDALQNFQIQFDRMTVNLAWAGSPSAIASEPVRYLARDEIEKWKHKDKSEGHPIDLSAVRVTSYGELAKIIDTTTPGLETGIAIPALRAGTFHECFVPCPRCGKPELLAEVPELVTDASQDELKPLVERAGYQVLEWEQITGWDQERDPEKVARLAVYECKFCKHRFPHAEIIRITQHNRWIPRLPDRSTASFQLARWYRDLPSCSFGAGAKAFYKAKDNPVELQSWVNNWPARGFQPAGQEVKADVVRSHCRAYDDGTIPFVPIFVFTTVDIRDTEIHAVVRAHGENCKTARIRADVFPRLFKPKPGEPMTGESLAVLDSMLAQRFPCSVDGKEYGINLTGIDSGWDTLEVYEYCRTRPRCVAMKGEENMHQVISYSQPMIDAQTKKPRGDSPWLISFQASYFRDLLLISRMRTTAGAPNDWMLPREVPDWYVDQMTSERKVVKKNKWGRLTGVWEKIGGMPNHILDCENMQEALQDFAKVRDLRLPESAPKAPDPEPANLLGRDVSGFLRRMRR